MTLDELVQFLLTLYAFLQKLSEYFSWAGWAQLAIMSEGL